MESSDSEIQTTSPALLELYNASLKIKFDKSQTKKESTRMYELINKTLNDPDSLFTLHLNKIAKHFVLNLIVDLIDSSENNDELVKKCISCVKRVLDIEYGESESAEYSKLLQKMLSRIVEIGIEESFFFDQYDPSEEESPDTFLSLVVHVLNLIDARTLLALNFKPIHLQFIIVNFPQSPCLSKIILALSENLRGAKLLSRDSASIDAAKLNPMIDSIFSILIKSCNLIYWFHLNDSATIRVIIEGFFSLSKFCQERLSASAHSASAAKKYREASLVTVKLFLKKLNYEANVNFRVFNYEKIGSFVEIISMFYESMPQVAQTQLMGKIMLCSRRVGNKLISVKRRITSVESQTLCKIFALIANIIRCQRVEFVNNHLASFELVWLNAFEINAKAACEPLFVLLRRRSLTVVDFVKKVARRLESQMTKGGLWKTSLALFDFCLTNELNEEDLFAPLMQNTNNILKRDITDYKDFNEYVEFLIQSSPIFKKSRKKKLLRNDEHLAWNQSFYSYFVNKKANESEWYLRACVELVLSMSSPQKFEFELRPSSLLKCLDLIRTVRRNHPAEKVIKEEKLVFVQVLRMLEISIDQMRPDYAELCAEFRQLGQFFNKI